MLNIAEDLEGADLLDSHLSFNGFIRFLKERAVHEKTMKVKFLEYVIDTFEKKLSGKDILTIDEIGKYEDLMQLIYAIIFPAIEEESHNLWSLSLPLKPTIFYATQPFYDLLRDQKTGNLRSKLIDQENRPRKKINLEFIYSFILKKLYNYRYIPANSMIHSIFNEATGITKFYRLNIDIRFVEIIPKGPLPELDFKVLGSHLYDSSGIKYLTEHLPLSLFRFEGISAISVVDISADYALENIKNIILDRTGCGRDSYYEQVIQSLKILAGKAGVEFGLIPFLKVNGKPVFSGDNCDHSILASSAKKYGEAEMAYLSLAENYTQEPRLLFFETMPASLPDTDIFLKVLKQNGVKAYGMLPVFHNKHLAGVLEVYSKEDDVLDQALLSRLTIALPILAQLLQQSIDEFESKLTRIIKTNFTSIQPAVEWKFNETAWLYLKDHHLGDGGEKGSGIDTIYFKNVYPLYGAVDIRNSTVERNMALRKDLQTQFSLLITTLSALQNESSLELVDELIYLCRNWQHSLSDSLTTAQEMNLNAFLKNEIEFFFLHLKESRPDLLAYMDPYLSAIDETTGIAFENRRALETSIQLINKTINGHLEAARDELQQAYPCYFEKFRTDGVEYDIYVGQSIAPDRPFDIIYLKNLHLWQLNSMATIAELTHSLLPGLPGKLLTTQLIFVHSNSIDISFRKDERRFDVEGGYNIRYQIVKKRIDKVHIAGSNERLTQPGKIAIIYFNDQESEEYKLNIKYLQERNVLNDDLEELDLEELQGVTGLKALRVGVRLG
ncbi:GAF domain-containing protein [Flavitalea flava]